MPKRHAEDVDTMQSSITRQAIAVAGDQKNRLPRTSGPDRQRQLDTVRTIIEHQVGDQQVDAAAGRLETQQRVCYTAGDDDGVTGHFKQREVTAGAAGSLGFLQPDEVAAHAR